MPDVAMPRLSDSMQEGTILKWLRAQGDAVRVGEELVEIENDEGHMVYEAEADGVLAIVAVAGQRLPVGALIAQLGNGGPEAGNGSTAAAPAAPARAGTAKGDVTIVEPTRLQQTVARRMAESKATTPDFVLHAEADMGAAVEQLEALAGAAPSGNDLVVKAAALALREHPRANAAYRDGRFELYSRVNVGVAVPAGGALVVPTVFDADSKPVRQIAAETRALAERVRSGTVSPPELSGGTFTVLNLGMHGMRSVVPVINPPQAAILGVGAIEPRPVVRDGALVPGHLMTLTLVCDHRILYGAEAAALLGRIRALLEQPLALGLEPGQPPVDR